MYIQSGSVKLSVVSKTGKEAVVAMLKPGDFVGEGALARQPVRLATATAVMPTSVLVIGLQEMKRVLHEESTLSPIALLPTCWSATQKSKKIWWTSCSITARSDRSRTLLLLARYGKDGESHSVLPKISQETLAEMVGTTRSRVNFFLNKFKKLGFIRYNGGLHVTDSLLTVVLRD